MTLALFLRFWWAPVIAGLIVLATIQAKRLDHAKADLAEARIQIAALSAAKAESEHLRNIEGRRDATSYSDMQAACLARTPITIAAGRTIERLVNAPLNADGSRGLCDAVCIRSLIGETAAESGRAPVSPRGW